MLRASVEHKNRLRHLPIAPAGCTGLYYTSQLVELLSTNLCAKGLDMQGHHGDRATLKYQVFASHRSDTFKKQNTHRCWF